MKFYTILVAGLLSLCLSACAPTVKPPAQNALDNMFNHAQDRQQDSLEIELDGLRRKAEILEKIHQYQPMIKVINIYLPQKQLPSGVYTHPQVVSVPLVYKQSHLKFSEAAMNSLFDDNNDSKSEAERKATLGTTTIPESAAKQPAGNTTHNK